MFLVAGKTEDDDEDCAREDRAGKDKEGPDIEVEAEDRLAKAGKAGADMKSDLSERDDTAEKGAENRQAIMLYFNTKAEIEGESYGNAEHAKTLEKTEGAGIFTVDILITVGCKEDCAKSEDEENVEDSLH